MTIKRDTKFYRKNEAEVMTQLGLKETINSGATWLEKGDGQNDSILAELKSTDKYSYTITKDDLNKVKHHALVAHKIPLFVIQFLSDNDIWIMVKPEDIQDLARYLKTGKLSNSASKSSLEDLLDWETDDSIKSKPKKMIRSSNKSRSALQKEIDAKWNKETKSAT